MSSSSGNPRKRWSAQMMLPATKRVKATATQEKAPSESSPAGNKPQGGKEEPDEFDALYTDSNEIQDLLAAEDTESAIELLRRDCPVKEIHPNMPSIIMIHHLYPIVPDRTLVDRQLEEYRKQRKIIKLKIGANPDEYSIIVTQEYLQQIAIARTRFEELETASAAEAAKGSEGGALSSSAPSLETHAQRTSRSKQGRAVRKEDDEEGPGKSGEKDPRGIFERLEELVKAEVLDVSIGKEKLMGLLACEEGDITILIRSGFLLIKDARSYWFSCPYSGLFLQNVIKGRKEILSLIRRKQFHEILERVLVRKKLRKSIFRIQYLLEDLTASGELLVVKTTSGNLLRLRK